MTKVEFLPQSLLDTALFCGWRYETRQNRDGQSKPTKVPYNLLTGQRAQSNNQDTFVPFAQAALAMDQYEGLGVGVFGDLCAIDIDHCVDDGLLSEMAADIIDTMASYTEYSPSGTGIRVLFRAPEFAYDATAYYINNQKAGLEVYVAGATKKFVTVTGNVLLEYGLEERGQQLQTVLDRYMRRNTKATQAVPPPARSADNGSKVEHLDHELIIKAQKAANGRAFDKLWKGDASGYPSRSEADIALCNMLAFWTGKDSEQMDSLFRQSGLMRDKWDRPQAGSTYGKITIENAVRNCREVYNPRYRAMTAAKAFSYSGMTLGDLTPENNTRYRWSDIGNGRLFADWFKDTARFVVDRKKWFVYDGKRWVADYEGLMAMERCKQLADLLCAYASGIEDEKMREDYMSFVQKWQRRSYRETILKDAASVYPLFFDAFDRDPYIFNCQNGTLNLRTHDFHTHNPDDFLSKIAGVQYDPAARCLRWEQYISEVMQEDMDKAVFLQKALGYTLTGDTGLECFFILYGPTSRNGKGTCMETYLRMIGDYGKTAKADTITQKQVFSGGSGPSEDVARLAGARFVNISEPDKKMRLSAALVKTLTGNDTINARFLNENSFDYRPQFKLFINTNHLPQVTDVTLFGSGRVKIIPFERHFTDQERDPKLKGTLAKPESLSGILNWCIAGLSMIEESGFDVPESVRRATEDYRNQSDKFGRFIADELLENSAMEVSTMAVYDRYKVWCARNGHMPESMTSFNTGLQNVGEIKKKRPANSSRESNPIAMLLGYELTPSIFFEMVQN